MRPEVREQIDAFPDPSPDAVPIGPGQLNRMDDSLHYGWSWHRYRFCYRKADVLKILDAGCGTGLSTLTLARLNPGSEVLGVDVSPRALELAGKRSEAAGLPGVAFREHDLDEPIAGGPFDFIACRHLLGLVDDPDRVLANLARVLDRRGLLYATFPTRSGTAPARRLRRAVGALCAEGTPVRERAEVARELIAALRPDHPIRQFESQFSGGGLPSVDRVVSVYLAPVSRDWDLEGAIATIERAGLKFLYAATGRPWQPQNVLGPSISEDLRTRVGELAEREQAILIDALDVSMHGPEYRIYACPADFEPRLPTWPDDQVRDSEAFDRLIPHRTGLVELAGLRPDPAAGSGGASYRAVSGNVGGVQPGTHVSFRAVDGRRTIAEIDRELAPLPLVEDPEVRKARWLDLANQGFILLESPDPRQNVDCVHLGPIQDRLDCPCPRRWVRACERHDLCTIDEVQSADPQFAALETALQRLGRDRVMACVRCPDYQPDE